MRIAPHKKDSKSDVIRTSMSPTHTYIYTQNHTLTYRMICRQPTKLKSYKARDLGPIRIANDDQITFQMRGSQQQKDPQKSLAHLAANQETLCCPLLTVSCAASSSSSPSSPSSSSSPGRNERSFYFHNHRGLAMRWEGEAWG